MLRLELPDGATVDELYDRLANAIPSSRRRCGRRCPLLQGSHVERGQALVHGDEVALLTPVSGG